MRLVDGDEGNGLLLQQGLEEVGFEPLGRDIDDLVRALCDGTEPCASLRLPKRAVDECRGRTGLRKRVDLIFHQRDQRRDDERDAREQQRGHLEADGFSRARGHDGDGLAAFEQALDDGLLCRAEALVAEGLLQDLQRTGEVLLRHGWTSFPYFLFYTFREKSLNPSKAQRFLIVRRGNGQYNKQHKWKYIPWGGERR